MNDNMIDAIYQRYMDGIEKVTEGTWIDRSAAGMALYLALTEQAERLTAPVRASSAPLPIFTERPAVFGDLERLATWLDENLDEQPDNPIVVDRAMDAIQQLQDAWPAEAAANVTLETNNAILERQRLHWQTTETQLRQEHAILAEKLYAAAMNLENETMNNALLREELDQLRAQVAKQPVDEVTMVQQIVEHGGSNGNGVAPTRVGKRRGRKTVAANDGPRLTAAETKDLAFALIRDLTGQLGHPVKMREFDDARPADKIATAEAVMRRLGETSWMAVVSAALAPQDAA